MTYVVTQEQLDAAFPDLPWKRAHGTLETDEVAVPRLLDVLDAHGEVWVGTEAWRRYSDVRDGRRVRGIVVRPDVMIDPWRVDEVPESVRRSVPREEIVRRLEVLGERRKELDAQLEAACLPEVEGFIVAHDRDPEPDEISPHVHELATILRRSREASARFRERLVNPAYIAPIAPRPVIIATADRAPRTRSRRTRSTARAPGRLADDDEAEPAPLGAIRRFLVHLLGGRA